MKKILDNKKLEEKNILKNKIKKFSIGVISCALSFTILTSPLVNNSHKSFATTKNVLKERQEKEGIAYTRWADGVKVNGDDFKVSTEGLSTNYLAMEYGKGEGYYDINKKFDGKDNDLCSGVVAANQFHWWLDRNKEYVERYRKQSEENGVIQKDTDVLKMRELNDDQSNFFDLIKTSFGNKALATERLLNMYINGYGYDLSLDLVRQSTPKSSINFFNKVFKENILTDMMPINYIDTFSKQIKEGLENHKVLGVSFAAFKNMGLGHIITVWGADFNKDNVVVALYITDSDDGDIKIGDKKVGMKRFKVNVDTNNSSIIKLTGFENQNSGGSLRHLYSLSTGEEYWKKYFEETEKTVPPVEKEKPPVNKEGNKEPEKQVPPVKKEDKKEPEKEKPQVKKEDKKENKKDKEKLPKPIDKEKKKEKEEKKEKITPPFENPKNKKPEVQKPNKNSSSNSNNGNNLVLDKNKGKGNKKVDSTSNYKNWRKVNNKWFYYNNKGVKQTGWVYDSNKWYFLAKNGEMKIGWIYDSNKWYFLGEYGDMKTGWIYDSSKWYFLGEYGDMKTGWIYNSNKWYFLETSGAMKTGWVYDSNKWYYLKNSGEMVTGNYRVNGKNYYFNQSGSLV